MAVFRERVVCIGSRQGTKIALLALAYVLAGWLGLALAIPPGYATGIFPPAGIALVCVLAFGDRAAAGVWLGSFILNAFVVGQASTPETLLVAAALGAGAACQALSGLFWCAEARAIRRA